MSGARYPLPFGKDVAAGYGEEPRGRTVTWYCWSCREPSFHDIDGDMLQCRSCSAMIPLPPELEK